ncbi:vomeronasal type-2 receptor 26-like [Xenopus laevis]|uniref:Vomeronasal type-2 receptor 26-like n=1 Tax=Xenopus laevis TaxID=8355 RepID=A0A8J1LUA8_XENLA|nr:vomeronasal type-2 receptor 26-like [Xenopus laevis]
MLGFNAASKCLIVLIHIIMLCVWPCKSGDQPPNPACRLQIIKAVEEYEYIQEGDIMIGGVMTVDMNAQIITLPSDKSKFKTKLLCFGPNGQNMKYLVDFRFAVEQTNKDPERLPNVTLGYHIYNSCGSSLKAVRSVLQILSGTREPVPNYSCVGKRNIAGFIGDLTSETTLPIAQILTVYGYSQISYGATDPALSDRGTFPYFFRTVQNIHSEFYALGQLLRHFGWTWVGIITSDDISGEEEYKLLAKYLSSAGVCIEFTLKLHKSRQNYVHSVTDHFKKTIAFSSTNVILICGTVILLFFTYLTNANFYQRETIILSSNWGANDALITYNPVLFNYSLVLVPGYHYDLDTPEMRSFLETFHPSNYPEDKLLGDIWMIYLYCLSKDPNKNYIYQYIYFAVPLLQNCTGQERITDIYSFGGNSNSPRVHLAVDMMSRALHDMNMKLYKKTVRNRERFLKSELHQNLKKLQLKSKHGEIFSFNENEEYLTRYKIYSNFITLDGMVTRNFVGEFSPWAPLDQQLSITSKAIPWKTIDSKIPRAQCTDNCLPGYRKMPIPEVQPCCYDCVPCSETEISNIIDSVSCTQCPDMEWPNEMKDQCVQRNEVFLSYSNDVISIFFTTISILFSLIIQLIFQVLITYRNTPIVRANNRSLSFLLLVSIKLSFLSVFLFLGRPVDITCMLRNITFGITFSIAVSSLLAKTIMVCVAFKATKPGSSWRKWVGVKLSNSVVLFCSSIQIIICMTWLAISPPFQELDLHTYPGTIIIQCNEGSAIGFYSVIGYMGLLVAVSFVLAFLARTLPDSFNEAKYITFSMLLFCSVWITMIPAYLSTKGKNTVCVEIFAILTSSAGLLACIFLPKCYTILFRAEMNTKTHLLVNKP